MGKNSGLRHDALPLIGLLGFALLLAWPAVLGGVPIAADAWNLWAPHVAGLPAAVHNPVLADSALQNLPWQVFVRRSLAAGEWPLWDPGQFAGYPFLGNDQNQLYYPIAWVLWLLPLADALRANLILHLWLVGIGMYLLARELGTSRTGSLLAGLAFAGSGQLYLHYDIPSILDIYVWLPWVLAATERAWRTRSWRWTAGAGLLFGVLTVSGHLPWFIYSSLFLAAWLGGRMLALVVDGIRARRGAGTPFPRQALAGQVARAAAIPAWGLALAAVHLLPFAEMFRLSSRAHAAPLAGPSPNWAVNLFLFGGQLRVLVPQFFGTSVGAIGAPMTNVGYVGLAAIALAVAALLLCRSRRVYYLGVLAILALGAAANQPGFSLIHRLPGLETEVPERAIYLFIVGTAALSGLGFDAFLAAAHARPWRALLAGGLCALLAVLLSDVLAARHQAAARDAALYHLQTGSLRQAALVAGALGAWAVLVLALRHTQGRRGRAALSGALLGLVVFDLLTYAPNFNTYVPPAALQPQVAAVNVLRADPGPWRIITRDTPVPMFVPNTATMYGLADVQGYDSLHLARYEDFWAAADPQVSRTDYFNVILRPQAFRSAQAALLNARYLVTAQTLPSQERSPALERIYNRDAVVYRNKAALPRVFVVGQAVVAPPAEIPARLARPDFVPDQIIYVEQPPPAGFTAGPAAAGSPGQAAITSYHNLSVDVQADLARPGWLVLGDVNYPGWQVTVDGRAAPLYTADYILRAVPLPAGRHAVHFFFRPASVLLGGAITTFAVLAALAVLVAGRRRAAPFQ